MPKNLNQHLVISLLFVFFISGCAHLFEKSASPSYFSAATDTDPALRAFYARRVTLLEQRFMAPVFHGNVVTWFSPDKAKFADNTVYLGNVIAWRALTTSGPAPAAEFAAIAKTIRHITKDLSPLTTLPDGTSNRGYFVRDDVTETTVSLDGKTYRVASDAQGDGNEMSQDQLVHLLFGYALAMNATKLHPTLPEASDVRQLIVEHAHQLGLRLKAYNYMVVNPAGKAVRRGADARGFAWPIARAISLLTGRDLGTYLVKVKAPGPTRDPVVIDASGLRETFYTALDGLSTGVCDLKVGTDQRNICSRFTLRMINALYFASRTFQTKPLYVQRMDADGDLLGATSARLGRGEKVPERYFAELRSAAGTDLASSTAPALWCRESRWIFMPTVCPEAGDGTVYSYNGIDFLTFFAALRYGAPVFKVPS